MIGLTDKLFILACRMKAPFFRNAIVIIGHFSRRKAGRNK